MLSLLPELETARLVLRVPAPEDALHLLGYMQRNRAHLADSGPLRDDAFFNLAACETRVAEGCRQARAGEAVNFVIWLRGDRDASPVGTVALTRIERGPAQSCSLGYGLDEACQGMGYMTEAARAAVDYAFDTLKLHRVESSYAPLNERSGSVLRRLGFHVEGFALDYVCLNGTWRDQVRTALINPADRKS